MKLKTGIDVQVFLNSVKKCVSDVYLNTAEGDHMNLKSALSQIVFAAAADKLDSLNLTVEFNPLDYNLMKPFIVE